jgi:hypothetical protein
MEAFIYFFGGVLIVSVVALALVVSKKYESPKAKEKRLRLAKLKREFEEMKKDF